MRTVLKNSLSPQVFLSSITHSTFHTSIFKKDMTRQNHPFLLLSCCLCLYYGKDKQITQENYASRSLLAKRKRTALENTLCTFF